MGPVTNGKKFILTQRFNPFDLKSVDLLGDEKTKRHFVAQLKAISSGHDEEVQGREEDEVSSEDETGKTDKFEQTKKQEPKQKNQQKSQKKSAADAPLPKTTVQFDALTRLFGAERAGEGNVDLFVNMKKDKQNSHIEDEDSQDLKDSPEKSEEHGYSKTMMDEKKWAESLFGSNAGISTTDKELEEKSEIRKSALKFHQSHSVLKIAANAEWISMPINPFWVNQNPQELLSGFTRRRQALAADYRVKHKGASRAFKKRKL